MHVSQIQVVMAFARDDSILLSLGSAIKAFSSSVGGRFQSLNVPHDAPPSVPRGVVILSKGFVNIAPDRIQVVVHPPEHLADDYRAAAGFASSLGEQVVERLIVDNLEYDWLGAIFEFEYPLSLDRFASSLAVGESIFDSVVNVDRAGRDMSSFELKFGYKDKLSNRIYRLSGYESKQIEIAPRENGGVLHIKSEDYPSVEVGVQLVLDVNNKPKSERAEIRSDFSEIWVEHKKAYDDFWNEVDIGELVERRDR